MAKKASEAPKASLGVLELVVGALLVLVCALWVGMEVKFGSNVKSSTPDVGDLAKQHVQPATKEKTTVASDQTPQLAQSEEVKVPRCVDSDHRCDGWAKSGECRANPGYMLHSCRRSCYECCEDRLPLRECAERANRGDCKSDPEVTQPLE